MSIPLWLILVLVAGVGVAYKSGWYIGHYYLNTGHSSGETIEEPNRQVPETVTEVQGQEPPKQILWVLFHTKSLSVNLYKDNFLDSSRVMLQRHMEKTLTEEKTPRRNPLNTDEVSYYFFRNQERLKGRFLFLEDRYKTQMRQLKKHVSQSRPLMTHSQGGPSFQDSFKNKVSILRSIVYFSDRGLNNLSRDFKGIKQCRRPFCNSLSWQKEFRASFSLTDLVSLNRVSVGFSQWGIDKVDFCKDLRQDQFKFGVCALRGESDDNIGALIHHIPHEFKAKLQPSCKGPTMVQLSPYNLAELEAFQEKPAFHYSSKTIIMVLRPIVFIGRRGYEPPWTDPEVSPLVHLLVNNDWPLVLEPKEGRGIRIIICPLGNRSQSGYLSQLFRQFKREIPQEGYKTILYNVRPTRKKTNLLIGHAIQAFELRGTRGAGFYKSHNFNPTFFSYDNPQGDPGQSQPDHCFQGGSSGKQREFLPLAGYLSRMCRSSPTGVTINLLGSPLTQ